MCPSILVTPGLGFSCLGTGWYRQRLGERGGHHTKALLNRNPGWLPRPGLRASLASQHARRSRSLVSMQR